jgi:hypothetical protein
VSILKHVPAKLNRRIPKDLPMTTHVRVERRQLVPGGARLQARQELGGIVPPLCRTKAMPPSAQRYSTAILWPIDPAELAHRCWNAPSRCALTVGVVTPR